MDQFASYIESGKEFAKDSITLLKRCHKPDYQEYKRTAKAVAFGVASMGFLGFIIKLIHIPICSIIIG